MIVAAIAEAIASGLTDEKAAHLVGIAPRSLVNWEVGLLHLYCPTSYVPLPELTVDIYGHRYLRRIRASMQVRATRSPSATARDFTLPRVRTSGFLAPGCEWTLRRCSS